MRLDYNGFMKETTPPRPGKLAMVSDILQNQVFSKGKPLLASFKLTYQCNLCCQQCPFYSQESPDLSYPAATRIIDRLYERGNRLLIFEGGEPLLWRDGERRIHDLAAYARQRFFSVGLTTNGTLPLDVPVDEIWVSIDGFADTHNALRRASIFEKVLQNVRASRHPRLYAHVTINAVNATEVPELLQFLDGFFRGITIQFYYPYHGEDALFLDFERRAALLEKIIELKRAGVHILNSSAALRALKHNNWTCRDTLIDNANPDGSLQQGCYLKGRADIDCSRCGFSPHTEISLACRGNLQAIQAGFKIFL